MGFVLIPSPVILHSHLLSSRAHCAVCVCVVRRGGGRAPSSLLCSKFTPSCPYSRCQFLPCSSVRGCGAGLITWLFLPLAPPSEASEAHSPLTASSLLEAFFVLLFSKYASLPLLSSSLLRILDETLPQEVLLGVRQSELSDGCVGAPEIYITEYTRRGCSGSITTTGPSVCYAYHII